MIIKLIKQQLLRKTQEQQKIWNDRRHSIRNGNKSFAQIFSLSPPFNQICQNFIFTYSFFLSSLYNSIIYTTIDHEEYCKCKCYATLFHGYNNSGSIATKSWIYYELAGDVTLSSSLSRWPPSIWIWLACMNTWTVILTINIESVPSTHLSVTYELMCDIVNDPEKVTKCHKLKLIWQNFFEILYKKFFFFSSIRLSLNKAIIQFF